MSSPRPSPGSGPDASPPLPARSMNPIQAQLVTALTASHKTNHELTPELRSAICTDIAGGMSHAKVASKYGLPRSTIGSTIRRFRHTHSFKTGLRSGRKPKLSDRQRDQIRDLVGREPGIRLADIIHRLELEVAERTVWNVVVRMKEEEDKTAKGGGSGTGPGIRGDCDCGRGVGVSTDGGRSDRDAPASGEDSGYGVDAENCQSQVRNSGRRKGGSTTHMDTARPDCANTDFAFATSGQSHLNSAISSPIHTETDDCILCDPALGPNHTRSGGVGIAAAGPVRPLAQGRIPDRSLTSEPSPPSIPTSSSSALATPAAVSTISVSSVLSSGLTPSGPKAPLAPALPPHPPTSSPVSSPRSCISTSHPPSSFSSSNLAPRVPFPTRLGEGGPPLEDGAGPATRALSPIIPTPAHPPSKTSAVTSSSRASGPSASSRVPSRPWPLDRSPGADAAPDAPSAHPSDARYQILPTEQRVLLVSCGADSPTGPSATGVLSAPSCAPSDPGYQAFPTESPVLSSAPTARAGSWSPPFHPRDSQQHSSQTVGIDSVTRFQASPHPVPHQSCAKAQSPSSPSSSSPRQDPFT